MKRAVAGLLLLASLSACVSTSRLPQAAAGAPMFDPILFFAGTTRGEGQLRIATRKTRVVTVDGQGVAAGDGAIRLDQVVTMAGQAPKRRQWTLRRDGQGGFSGVLSDAAGPVSGTLVDGRLRLRFAMKGGLRAEQTLALQADGRTVHNVMIVRKFGLAVARLDETIRRVEDGTASRPE